MKKKYRLPFFIVMVCVVTCVIGGYRSYKDVHAARLQRGIAEQIVRFHVRANSDSERDQNLKLLVKNAIVTYLEPLLQDSQSLQQSKDILESQKENICLIARNTLAEHGSDDAVCAYFEMSYFPMKTYGDFTFPPGEYEAFRVDIGEHQGKNWWCVLYPPLCFVDATYTVVPENSKETLKHVLTEEEYQTISKSEVKYQFKYLKFLNQYIRK